MRFFLFLVCFLFSFPSLAAPSTKYATPINRGVSWLIHKANPNGSFGNIPGFKQQGHVGITALSIEALSMVLPYITSKKIAKKAISCIEKGTQYLLGCQEGSGAIYTKGSSLKPYETAIALSALIEVQKRNLAIPGLNMAIQKAKNYLIRKQFDKPEGISPSQAIYGGWSEVSGTKETKEVTLAVTHVVLEALHKAKVSKDSKVWKKVLFFLNRCQNRSESNDYREHGFFPFNDGGFIYQPGKSKAGVFRRKQGTGYYAKSYGSMTYAGLKSLVHANLTKEDPRVKAAFYWIQKHYTLEENYGMGSGTNPQGGKQGIFYYYMIMAKALDAYQIEKIKTLDGKVHYWRQELANKLLSLQKKEGFWQNSNPRWWEGNSVLVTSYALIALGICCTKNKGE
ncbi:MAG: hypothetical protein D6785_01305 [Planctomycetota bacterium]|nr:MAG: hypothetical protein D6785_01305 [Planctomycetota bacterium]